MDEFPAILAQNFGLKPHSKSPPMAASKRPTSNFGIGSSIGSKPTSKPSNSMNFDGFSDDFPNNLNSKGDSFEYDSVFGSSNSKPVYDDDVFGGNGFSAAGRKSDGIDDLLGNLGKMSAGSNRAKHNGGFDDLVSGFDGFGFSNNGAGSGKSQTQKSTIGSAKSWSSNAEDPFVVLESISSRTTSTGMFLDPLEFISKLNSSGSTKADGSSMDWGIFDDLDSLNGFAKSGSTFSTESNHSNKNKSPLRAGSNTQDQKTVNRSPISEQNLAADDIWETISQSTRPSRVPPIRPPPPATKVPYVNRTFIEKKKVNTVNNPKKAVPTETNNSGVSSIDELEDFAMGRVRTNTDETKKVPSYKNAMKDAMDRAEAKFRNAKEMRERKERMDDRKMEEKEREIEKRVKGRQGEKITREAREREEAEARHRVERAAVQRAQAEARARARLAAEAKGKVDDVQKHQSRKEDDMESLFGMGARPSSAPRPRTTTPETAFDTQFQGKTAPVVPQRTKSGSSPGLKKASSMVNIVDDLSSIVGAASSFEEFREIEGESEERRKCRFERQQRTQERAAQALAEKNKRDLQTQLEQEERHKIAETLDVEIKRWSAGKEGNLRAMLSTLQYVLWADCGWQPVSLTDLITSASVKKVYRKATLCIHPDKVQQKGASLQQKYIAEKVFDLLKEAWNKLNSEELY